MIRIVPLLVLLAAWAAGPAAAHFTAGTKIRTLIVEEAGDGLRAYVSMPAPLLFSDRIVAAQRAQTPLASPFVTPVTVTPATASMAGLVRHLV